MADPGDLSPTEAAFGHVGRRQTAIAPDTDHVADKYTCGGCGMSIGLDRDADGELRVACSCEEQPVETPAAWGGDR